MKNKKSLLSLGLLALVLVLGVGYAVVSNVTLEFGGKATVANSVLKVDIAKVETTTKPDKVTVNHTFTAHSKEASFTITDMALNDTVTIVYTIDNHETDVTASLTDNLDLSYSNTDYFDVSYVIADKTIDPATNGEPGTTTVTVTVKLKKTPVTVDQGTTDISFTLDASAVDNANAG